MRANELSAESVRCLAPQLRIYKKIFKGAKKKDKKSLSFGFQHSPSGVRSIKTIKMVLKKRSIGDSYLHNCENFINFAL